MNRTYEGMFLLDNDAVRAGWESAKAVVTGLIEKHEGEVLAARRWDERPLAYPVKHRRRATYLLAYYSIGSLANTSLVRDLDINEVVLRHLLMRVERVPAEELELSKAELADDFVVPEPPADDVVEIPEPPAEEDSGREERGSKPAEEGESQKRREGGEAEGSPTPEKREGDALVGASQETPEGEKE